MGLLGHQNCRPAAGFVQYVPQQPGLSTSKSCCTNVSITAARLCTQHRSVAHWQDQGCGSHQPGRKSGTWCRAGTASQAANPLGPAARNLGVGVPCTTCEYHGMGLPCAQTAVPRLRHPLPLSTTLQTGRWDPKDRPCRGLEHWLCRVLGLSAAARLGETGHFGLHHLPGAAGNGRRQHSTESKVFCKQEGAGGFLIRQHSGGVSLGRAGGGAAHPAGSACEGGGGADMGDGNARAGPRLANHSPVLGVGASHGKDAAGQLRQLKQQPA